MARLEEKKRQSQGNERKRANTIGRRLAGSTLGIALAGSLLAFLAQPPCSLWPLAWIAPAPWLFLLRDDRFKRRGSYFAAWLAGLAYWLAALNSLTQPHWLTAVGWVVLSAYLGCYLPAFMAVTRIGVKRLRLPLIVAAPVVWTGLECVQTHVLDGFNFASLGHSQYRWLQIIQISDLGGAYAVSALVMLVAASLVAAWGPQNTIATIRLVPGIGALAAALIYGQVRLSQSGGRPGPKVALIQGSIDTRFDAPAVDRDIAQHYVALTLSAARAHTDLDLIVWPEGQWPWFVAELAPGASLPADDPPELFRSIRENGLASRRELEMFAREMKVPLLVGLSAIEIGIGERRSFNSVQYVDPLAGLGERYDKRTLVMFGEYVPFAEAIPFLRKLTPVHDETHVGRRLPAWRIGDARLAATVCFESSLPQRVRDNILELRERGEEPDVLVNATNDGWFFGTSALDLHLICGVFRAIECRKPFIVAANTGFSASIDADGRLSAIGPRRKAAVIVAEVELDNRTSLYLLWGDFFGWGCVIAIAAICTTGSIIAWRSRVAT